MDANNVLFFEGDGEGGLLYAFSGNYSLVVPGTESSTGDTVLRNPAGIIYRFHGPADEIPELRGKIKEIRTRSGSIRSFEYDPSSHLLSRSFQTEGEITYEMRYEWTNYDRIESVMLKRISGDAHLAIASASYTYYDETTPQGNFGDLQRVTRWNGAVNSGVKTSESYYTYHLPAEGFTGLKYALDGESFQRLLAVCPDPEDATDAQLAAFADHYFEYDEVARVTLESTSGGKYTYTYEYFSRGYIPISSSGGSSSSSSSAALLPDVPNTWAKKTVETLPDGNKNIVYSNSGGQPMLFVFQAGSQKWCRAYRYDEKWSLMRWAMPSAVENYNEANRHLFTLRSHSGLVHHSWKANQAPDEDLVVLAVTRGISQGEQGDILLLSERGYTACSLIEGTIHALARIKLFQSTSGDGEPAVTVYRYEWFGGKFQFHRRTTEYPTVLASQNGTGELETRTEVFNTRGQMEWLLDERGFISYNAYDLATGAVVQTIRDVQTAGSHPSGLPSGWTTPEGAGLNLITDYEHDNFGRITREMGPLHSIDLTGTDSALTEIRRTQWTVYQDASHEVWRGAGYAIPGGGSSDTYTLVNPVQITRVDYDGRTTDEITATRGDEVKSPGALTAYDTFSESSWVRRSATHYDDNDRLDWQRLYVSLSTPTYNETTFDYNNMGRRIYTKTPMGTITRLVLTPQGWEASLWVGMDDTGATPENPHGSGTSSNNMVQVKSSVYDGGADGGDGNLTTLTLYADGTSTRTTYFDYDFRNRQITVTGELDFLTKTTYDNVDRAIQTDRYNGSEAPANLIGRETSRYDGRSRSYDRARYAVDLTTTPPGAVGNALHEFTWYDPAGNVIKLLPQGTLGFTRTAYDGVGRVTVSYAACNASVAGGTAAGSVDDDFVLEQTEAIYDKGGNVIFQRVRERDDNATGSGPLLESTGTNPHARVSYQAIYPDAVGRNVAAASYGTHGGTEPEWPTTIPDSSETCLVSLIGYNPRGEAFKSTDPRGTVTQQTFDDAGQLIKTIENYIKEPVDSAPDINRTTEYVLNADGRLTELIARNVTTEDQHTHWIYGTALTNSGVASYDLVRFKDYPGSTEGSDRVEYSYNQLGELAKIKDQNGTVHEYDYDLMGRFAADRVTTVGTGIDNSVRQVLRTYEVRGLVKSLSQSTSSAKSPASTTITDQILFIYNAFGQPLAEVQQHSGPVIFDGDPQVSYTYANGSANTVRRLSTVYPDGRTINLDYGPSDTANPIDHLTNRVRKIKDGSTELVNYVRRGNKSTVSIEYVQPGITMTYLRQSGTGDRYTGLDRFNRITDIPWLKSGSDVEHYQYGFDLAGNRTWRANKVAEAGSHPLDEGYAYDGLYQLSDLRRGILDSTSHVISGTPAWEEQFAYDLTGNWDAYTTTVGGEDPVDQTRTHNAANEILTIDGSGTTVVYDAVGNMTRMPGIDTDSRDLVWDAWNRLIRIADGGEDVATYRYDGLTRRIEKFCDEDGTWVHRHFYYSEQWQVLEERVNTATTAERQFVWGLRYIDDLVLRDRFDGETPERLYATHDQWHVTAITDETGAVVERYAYDAFGKSILLAPSYTVRSGGSEYDWETRFGAYRFDHESGLYCVRYRYLHPTLGRWLSRDPIGEIDDENLYASVKNSPVNLVDYFGLECGSFKVTPKKLETGDLADYYDGAAEVGGFTVEFDLSGCDCPLDKLKLVQAIKSSGFSGLKPYMDTTNDQDKRRKAGDMTLPRMATNPASDPRPSNNRFDDSPNNRRKVWGGTTFSIEVCAFCCPDTTNEVLLGCTTFEFDDQTKKVKGGGGPARPPGKLWNEALQNWKKA